MFTYCYYFDVNLSKISDSVNKFTSDINSFMAGFHFDEKIIIKSKMEVLKITSNRILIPQELAIIQCEIDKQFIDLIYKYEFKSVLELI